MINSSTIFSLVFLGVWFPLMKVLFAKADADLLWHISILIGKGTCIGEL